MWLHTRLLGGLLLLLRFTRLFGLAFIHLALLNRGGLGARSIIIIIRDRNRIAQTLSLPWTVSVSLLKAPINTRLLHSNTFSFNKRAFIGHC